MRFSILLVCALAGACSSSESSPSKASGGAGGASGNGGSTASGGTFPGGGSGGQAGSTGGSAGSGGQAGSDAGPPVPVVELIHEQHRFIPGSSGMFGGWGPHLGHLLRAPASSGSGSTLWLVDDVCAPGTCDVNQDFSIGYFERTASGWQARETVTLPGTVQQNTATIADADGTTLSTFGVDVAGHVLVECRYAPKSGPLGCNPLPFTLGSNANYIGAAISPGGSRLVWWTGVVDNGAGTFHYVVDYGGGWNGPRSGPTGGYNDASYVNIAFGGASASAFTMHVQLVSGIAPNWSFLGAVGYGDLTTTDAVSFANVLAPVSGDPVMSTNDIWTDPDTGDTHLVGRTLAGAAVYFHRPAGGAWSAASFSLPATFRARFIVSGGRLVLLYGPNAGGLAYRIAQKSDRPAGSAIDWGSLAETSVVLPPNFGAVQAIYPESPAYQTAPAQGIHAAIVGATAQFAVSHAAIEP